MLVSAEMQVRTLGNGAFILFFRFQVSYGQDGDNDKKMRFLREARQSLDRVPKENMHFM